MRKTLIAALAGGFTALALANPALSMPSTPAIEHGQMNAALPTSAIGIVIGATGTAIADILMDMDIGPITGPTPTGPTHITEVTLTTIDGPVSV